MNTVPKIIPMAITESMESLVDNKYIDIYHDVFIFDLDGNAGVAAEVAFSVEDEYKNYFADNFINAINEIHKQCYISRIKGDQYNTSAFSLRFTNESNAYMSMSEGHKSAYIELDMLMDTFANEHIFRRYENNMLAIGGRPHWGLDYNVMTGGKLKNTYQKFKKWHKVYKKFNKYGTFNNRFTERMGFNI